MAATNNGKKVSFDELQAKIERLLATMKERQDGFISWHIAFNEQLKELHSILCPLFSARE